jgi:hypothetical protein
MMCSACALHAVRNNCWQARARTRTRRARGCALNPCWQCSGTASPGPRTGPRPRWRTCSGCTCMDTGAHHLQQQQQAWRRWGAADERATHKARRRRRRRHGGGVVCVWGGGFGRSWQHSGIWATLALGAHASCALSQGPRLARHQPLAARVSRQARRHQPHRPRGAGMDAEPPPPLLAEATPCHQLVGCDPGDRSVSVGFAPRPPSRRWRLLPAPADRRLCCARSAPLALPHHSPVALAQAVQA